MQVLAILILVALVVGFYILIEGGPKAAARNATSTAKGCTVGVLRSICLITFFIGFWGSILWLIAIGFGVSSSPSHLLYAVVLLIFSILVGVLGFYKSN